MTSAGKNGDKRTGGIAWQGSLVGSQNKDNLGYRYSNPLKRYKKGDDGTDGVKNDEIELPSNLVVQFQNRQGDELASSIDIPTNSTIDDLQSLVHSLIENTVYIPTTYMYMRSIHARSITAHENNLLLAACDRVCSTV